MSQKGQNTLLRHRQGVSLEERAQQTNTIALGEDPGQSGQMGAGNCCSAPFNPVSFQN